MDKRGQEGMLPSQGLALVKMLIAIILVLIVFGMVATACNFLRTVGLDSGTEKTFDSIVQRIIVMSQVDYEGKIEEYPLAFVGDDLAIIGFNINQDSISIAGVEIKRPFECGESKKLSCLTLCSFEETNSCSGEALLKSAVLGTTEIKSKDIQNGGFYIVGERKGTIEVEKDADLLYVKLIES